jgi:hypothetical protein
VETGYEIVHTMTDYWDGPRGGIAQFQGRPHVYESLFDQAADDWTDVFLLQPINDETLQLALEDWAIWKRWEAAYTAGLTTIETHPALPADRQRHEELQATLSERLRVDPTTAVRARGDFRVRDAQDILWVRWTPL